MKRKKVHLNTDKTAHCTVKLYETEADMPNESEPGVMCFSLDNSGAGLVSRRFMHTVLHANKVYPIVIKNKREEEEILSNLSSAIKQFYNWYWKVVDEKEKSK